MSAKKPSDTKKNDMKDLPKKEKGAALRDDDLTKVVGGTKPQLGGDITQSMHMSD